MFRRSKQKPLDIHLGTSRRKILTRSTSTASFPSPKIYWRPVQPALGTIGRWQTGAANGELLGRGFWIEREGHVEYEFYTAWSPPIELLQTVAVQWPTLKFILAYEEPGMAFKGLAKFQGEIHEDRCISL